jgi:hypothetical protein
MVKYGDWRQESQRLNELEVKKLAKRLCVSMVLASLLGTLMLCLGS